MAIITVDTAKRSINPGVFNVKQYLNGTETITWELSENTTNDGEVTLDDYDAFLVLSENGIIDEVMLTKQKQNGFLRVLWNVGTYATERTGYVKYQIVFRSSQFDTLGVLSDNAAIRGVYNLVDKNTFNTNRVFKKSNGHVIKWDATNLRWGLYNGSELLDYQKVANEEPQCGMWNSVAVGNTEAAAWFSHEAVMQISESIGADQSITAGFPTILRQLWARMSKGGVTSVNNKTGDVTIYASDIGAADEVHKHVIADVENLQNEFKKYLPVSGGTMTGNISMSGKALLNLRQMEFDPGAYLDFHYVDGVDYTSRIGETASGKLGITAPNGLAVNGKTVALSVNGAKADSAGNISITAVDQANKDGSGNVISDTYVKKAGDTMTGSLTTSGNFTVTGSYNGLIGSGTQNAVVVRSDSGAGIVLYGKEYNNGDVAPGQMTIHVSNGTQTQYLTAKPDGTFTWQGKNIITAAGGTFDGSIFFSKNATIGSANADSCLSLRGGSTMENGSCLYLMGHDYENPTAAGHFRLRAANLNGFTDLVGYQGGNITWGGKKVLIETDFSQSADLSTGVGYTKLPNGLYLMWGSCFTSAGSTTATHNFPIPFPTFPHSVVLMPFNEESTTTVMPKVKIYARTKSSFSFTTDHSNGAKFMWIAIGS